MPLELREETNLGQFAPETTLEGYESKVLEQLDVLQRYDSRHGPPRARDRLALTDTLNSMPAN